jgi:hypothetical protein
VVLVSGSEQGEGSSELDEPESQGYERVELSAVDVLEHEEEEEEGLQGVFKRLRRNGHQLEKDAANSSAQTVTQKEAEPRNNSPCVRRMTFGVQAQPSFSPHAMYWSMLGGCVVATLSAAVAAAVP